MADVHILIVEDERGISEPLQSHLAREGFISAVAPTLEEARAAFIADPPDLILLDVMLPDGDGRDLCREFRGSSDVPIIMLTARGEDVDKIIGLELGADDYVVKPFSAGELVARIRAILRRGRAPDTRTAIEIGDIRLEEDARAVTRSGEAVTLAAREFDLLACLMRNPGRVLRREQIMDEVWDTHWFGSTKTLDVHIAWLRKKLEDDPSHPRYITTIRGVGFRFAAPDDVANAIEPG
jgi:two-component system response regulator RegX3